MKFIVDRDILLSALSVVEKFVPSKSPITLLSGIRFIASPDYLSLSATDLDMGIEHKIPVVDTSDDSIKILETGSKVFPARIFSEIARKMPMGEVMFSCSDGRVEINAGNFSMTLPYFESEDFPEITRDELSPAMNFSQKLFKNMIKQTIFARAEESTSRPQLTGILVECRQNTLNMVALDGFRIAWRKENLEKDSSVVNADFSLIIPGRTLMEVSRIFGDGEESFTLYAGKNRVEFRTESTVISSRLLEGNFIDYEQVTRVEPKTIVDIDVDSIFSAIDRGLTLAREGSKNNLIRFRISDGLVEVSAETEMGSLCDRMQCQKEGDDLLIAFNARFLMDALRSIETPDVHLTFSGESGPCIMRPKGAQNHVNFVLPVKIRGEDY
ncbi:MAG: polymerase subunit beta [Thermoanaerobacteraceae bacterium]|jgi:DNA polymerase-3 subunit beta|uniref:Beta sliding clamp n=1 Tax=Biomaibacter acetigenes TaxID=2316383 RepID=A0A3G2R1N5_9FIRM|nr:DNA polymerase III subunit beta [Biomaibacter acetigenes]AYO29195.1 DNA polymerase III subunit beta [Biomaibacter acetigenes]MDK2877744.1 polymerase subunit beta [Thermoanaerobacteraceae bacterium]MDN5301890.1 polymerase subunit beta [Thermoanaerobacteraceae bacterium]MDN5312697.1 polymerase subunit beta [Thermoanaerobacteraceae bacterium]